MTGGYWGDTPLQEKQAKEIFWTLFTAYPGHPWFVTVYDGGFSIKHLDFDGPWGMRAKFKDTDFSSSALKHNVVMKAGEWLDRANIPRTRYDPDTPEYRVEGVPEKYQPKILIPEGS